MGKFTYKGYSPEAQKKTLNQLENGRDSFVDTQFEFFKASEGKNTIRILPATWEGAGHFGLVIFLHNNVGADKAAYLCSSKMKEEPCCICDERTRMQNSDDKDYLWSLTPNRRLLVYVIDRDQEEKGPMLWSMPKTLASDIVDYSEDPDTGEKLPIDHPDEGYDISFNAINAGKINCEYKKIRVSTKPSYILEDEKEQDDLLDFLVENPLPSILTYYDSEYIESKFMAKEADSVDEEEEEEEDIRRSSRRSSRKTEDEEEDIRRSSRRSSRKTEDEDEKPPRRSSRRSSKKEDEEVVDDEKEADILDEDVPQGLEDDEKEVEDEDDTPKSSRKISAWKNKRDKK